MWLGTSVWVSAYLAVGVEAVEVAKVQTSTRVALAENRANCTLLPTMVAPSGVTAWAGMASRSSRGKQARRPAAKRAGRGMREERGLMSISLRDAARLRLGGTYRSSAMEIVPVLGGLRRLTAVRPPLSIRTLRPELA